MVTGDLQETLVPFGMELVPGIPGWALQKQTETAGDGGRRGCVFMGDQPLWKEEGGGTAGDINTDTAPTKLQPALGQGAGEEDCPSSRCARTAGAQSPDHPCPRTAVTSGQAALC